MQCGTGARSASVSCLVVGGAESDVASCVHWCDAAVRGAAVRDAVECVAVGWCGVVCRHVSCFTFHLFCIRYAGRRGEEAPSSPETVSIPGWLVVLERALAVVEEGEEGAAVPHLSTGPAQVRVY